MLCTMLLSTSICIIYEHKIYACTIIHCPSICTIEHTFQRARSVFVQLLTYCGDNKSPTQHSHTNTHKHQAEWIVQKNAFMNRRLLLKWIYVQVLGTIGTRKSDRMCCYVYCKFGNLEVCVTKRNRLSFNTHSLAPRIQVPIFISNVSV